MSSWTDGYVSDIGYTHGFYREMSPSVLELALLIKGIKTSRSIRTYCELGCGQGFSINLLAAANPEIEFYANDFNPAQILNANNLVSEAGITNVKFSDDSFSEFRVRKDLPTTFDVIALHGIYSWVSVENRQEIIRFIRERSKPGTIVYISYNALPGWSAAMPIRQLLIKGGRRGVDTSAKVEQGLALLSTIRSSNCAFFLQNPNLGPRFLDALSKLSKSYIAHEYLNKDWRPFYFCEVAADLAEAKFTFGASAHIHDMIDALHVNETQRAVLANFPDVETRETVRDFFLNQQFRRDIYVRGKLLFSPHHSQETWMHQRFSLATVRHKIPLTTKGILGEIEFQENIYAPILDALSSGPKPLADIVRGSPFLMELPWSQVMQAMAVFCATGHVQPALSVKSSNARHQRCNRFNAAVMKRAEQSSDLAFLASPVTGSGLAIDRFSQMFLIAYQEKHKAPVDYVWSRLSVTGQKLIKNGRTLETDAENLSDLEMRYNVFAEEILPVLKMHEIS